VLTQYSHARGGSRAEWEGHGAWERPPPWDAADLGKCGGIYFPNEQLLLIDVMTMHFIIQTRMLK
jgi:hypothetical protein